MGYSGSQTGYSGLHTGSFRFRCVSFGTYAWAFGPQTGCSCRHVLDCRLSSVPGTGYVDSQTGYSVLQTECSALQKTVSSRMKPGSLCP